MDELTDLVCDKHISILAHLFDFNMFWTNDLTTLEIKTKNSDRQLENLINHLFSNYKLPRFALNIWTDLRFKNNEFDWFMHLAEGHNLRTATKLPFDLTKKIAHSTNSAPIDFSFVQAMVWGVLTFLECSTPLKREICAHSICQSVHNMDFWQKIFVFLRENTMLDIDQVRPLIDFIYHLKYSHGAPFPNFSIKGRNPAQLLEQMGDWHKETTARNALIQRNARNQGLGKVYKKIDYQWKSHFPTWDLVEGSGDRKKEWKIVELTSSDELRKEGGALGHCVASYDEKCFNGTISIFSLSLNNKKKFTIELRSTCVHQVRGSGNNKIDQVGRRILEKWADKNRFQIASNL